MGFTPISGGGQRSSSGFIDLLGVNFFTEIHRIYPDVWWGSEVLQSEIFGGPIVDS